MGPRFVRYVLLACALLVIAAPATQARETLTTSPRDLAIASGTIGVAFALFGLVIALHLMGKIRWLAALASSAARVTGLPAWAALPGGVTALALLAGAFGLYWDVGLHVDYGRDSGPFGNPSHFAVLGSLLGIVFGGVLAIVLARGTCTHRPSLRLADGWQVPLGAVALTVCGMLALMAIPLDELWHELFGLDVTIWGPTHVLAIGGGSLATLALWMLLAEGERSTERESGRHVVRKRWVNAVMAGGFLLSVTTLHSEFEAGFPQFSLLYHPVIVVLSGAIALVAARLFIGRGGALQAVAVYLVLRGGFLLIVGSGFDLRGTPFPLFVVEALLVEAIALGAIARRWPLLTGALCGLAIATVGLAAEWWWTQQVMPLPWNRSLLPELLPLAAVAGVAGGLLGAATSEALAGRRSARGSAARWAPALAGALAIACLVVPIRQPLDVQPSANVRLLPATGAQARRLDGPWANLDVRIEPASAVRDARWLTVSSWQGGGSQVVQLRRVADGRYRTDGPVPVSGRWKTMLRLHVGSSMVAVPVYLPADGAIDAPQVAATASFTRPFRDDREILQREFLGGPVWLQVLAYGGLALIISIWIAVLTWTLRRMTFPWLSRPVRRA